MSGAPERPLLATGIPGFDQLLGGGIPSRQVLVVCGRPGTGKTVMCSQIAFDVARRGVPVVVATVTSEPHDKLVDELSGFSFFDRGLIGSSVFLLSVYPSLKKGAKEARDVLLKAVADRKAKLLFVDGLRALRDLWNDEAMLRDFLYELGVGLAALGCVGLVTTEYAVEELMRFPEATTVDGIVALSLEARGARRARRAEVVKLRGRAHLQGQHFAAIDDGGVRIVPRLETVVGADVDFEPRDERLSFGVQPLDDLVGGGIPALSTTLLAGSTGIGKTLLAARFVHEGARRGEPALFVTYSEPPKRLVARAAAVGIDLAPHVASGRVRIEYVPGGERETDDLVDELLRDVRESGARRVVVDGLGELEAAVADPTRARAFMHALIIALRGAGATTLFVKEVATIAGPQLDFSDTPIAVTAENMMFLRHVELRGKLHRIVSVLKMRESDYDPHVREFVIGRGGFELLEPLRWAHGLLTGVAAPLDAE